MSERERSGFIFTMDALLTMTLSVLILSAVSMHHFHYPNAEALDAQRLAHDVINACIQSTEHPQECPFAFPPEQTCGTKTLRAIAGRYPTYRFFIQYEDPWLLGLLPDAVTAGAGGLTYAQWYETNRAAIDTMDRLSLADRTTLAAQFIQYINFAREDLVGPIPLDQECIAIGAVQATCPNAPYNGGVPDYDGTWDIANNRCRLALNAGDKDTCEDITAFPTQWDDLSKLQKVMADDAQDPLIRYVSTHGINFFATDLQNPTVQQIVADRELDRLVPQLFPDVYTPEKTPPETNPPSPREYAARTVKEAQDSAAAIKRTVEGITDVIIAGGTTLITDDIDPARFIKFRRCFDNDRFFDDPKVHPDVECDTELGYLCSCSIPTDPPPRTKYCVEREFTLCGLNLERDQCGQGQVMLQVTQPLACPRIVTVKVCVWKG